MRSTADLPASVSCTQARGRASTSFVEDVHSYVAAGEPAPRVERWPDGRMSLVLRAFAGGSRGDLYVAGPRTQALFKRPVGFERAVMLRLEPGWSAALFGAPAHLLRDRMVDVAELWGGAGRALRDDVLAHGDTARIAQRLTDALHARARQARHESAALLARRAVRLFEASEVRVESVAAQLDVSARHLRRVFTEHVGVSPKEFARGLRLRRAVALSAMNLDWASIAQRAGYYDQAHMILEFRALAGVTPTAYRQANAAQSA